MEEPNTNTNTDKNKNPSAKIDNNNDLSWLNSDSLLYNNVGGGGFHKGVYSTAAVSDLDIMALRVSTYTSLKDLLPPPSSPRAGMTSPPAHNSSWHEIPIRNQLVKQAALAYLQPMSSPQPDAGDKGVFGKLVDGCSWWRRQCQCFSWIKDVLFKNLREVFCWEVDDDEEEDDEKVD
ncbi:hypothetical protein Dsin_024574 [Dipteronia sinensis]|uniref:Uncharacterized protein n=1 Tax=Dipteronia sinensis TaxID=43782 RepID=A0AAE0DXI5_9ROSI|nr:hypothetical protein Dsin_024574 [Dipteronia sinensis]